MKAKEPVQEFFSIGDVCTLTDLKPHVLRYWESQFKFLHPAKNRSGNRVYQRREIELIMLVKQLLYIAFPARKPYPGTVVARRNAPREEPRGAMVSEEKFDHVPLLLGLG